MVLRVCVQAAGVMVLRTHGMWRGQNGVHLGCASAIVCVQVATELITHTRGLMRCLCRWGKDLRVAEMNTISNSGARGISNSLAAALWTLDGAFEVAAAGAAGINLHWGDGQALYAALLRQSGGASIVKPPYYAYLMFQMALGTGANFMPQALSYPTPNSRLKIWSLTDSKTGEARVVLINKHATDDAGVVLRFPESAGFGDGKLLRLVGQKGLEDQWTVSLGGVAYTIGGKPFGIPEGERVVKSNQLEGRDGMEVYPVSYTISMPPGSAALLILRKGT